MDLKCKMLQKSIFFALHFLKNYWNPWTWFYVWSVAGVLRASQLTSWRLRRPGGSSARRKPASPSLFQQPVTKIFFKYQVICSRKECKALSFIMRGNLRVRPAGVRTAPPSPKRPRTDTEQESSIVCACQSLNSASQRLYSAAKFRLDCKFSWLCGEF